ncbi:hypothetical protein [Mycolicibacterium aichiense]|nr:hypothetical protein [Mycolicibacterium aichiense]
MAAAIAAMAMLPVLVGVSAAQSAKSLVANCQQLAGDPQWVGICP